MPLTFQLDLLPATDPPLIDAIQSVAKTFSPDCHTFKFQWRVFDNETSTINLADLASNADLKVILDERGEVLRWCTCTFQEKRGGSSVTIDRKPDGSLRLSAEFPDAWSSDAPMKTRAAIALRKGFAQYAKTKMFGTIAPEIADFYTRRESTLIQLEALNAKITIENDQHRRDLERRLEEERGRTEEGHTRRLEALDAEYRSKAEALLKKETDLDERKKLLDDRDNTHARRQIQEDVKKILKERNTDFSLTQKTMRKRWPAASAFAGLIFALAIASGWALWATTQPLNAGEPFWYPIVRFAISLSAFGSSVVFFIRWQDRWSEAHSDEEFRLKRFDLDIARASWLVEVVLEWTREKAAIPSELIQKLATGLFEESASGPLLKHPAEEILGALLSSPAGINLKFPGGDVSLDRKAVKEMARRTD